MRRGARASRREADDRIRKARARRALGAHDPARSRARDDRRRDEAGALSDLSAVAPWDPGRPCEIRVEFKNTEAPDKLRFRAGVERVDDRIVVASADNWWEAWRRYFF